MTDSDNRYRDPSREREDAAPGPENLPPAPISAAAADIAVVYRRAGAYAVDWLFVQFVVIFVGVRAGAVSIDPGVTAAEAAEVADPSLGIWGLVALVVYRWAMQSGFGFTIGKALLGLRVVADDGSAAGPIPILGREFTLALVSNLVFLIPSTTVELAIFLPVAVLALNLWVAIRRRDHRGIHDLPVQTRVIRARREDTGRGSMARPL